VWLIVGLGNPKDNYSHNRHNIGFMCVDSYLSHNSYSTISNSNFKSLSFKSNNYILIKPQTYMNLSGQSVSAVASYYKIDSENIIVIHDDLDLGFGAIKYKKGGGHGGHNGLKSIDEHIGRDYIRIRVGIGRPFAQKSVSDYVLSDFSKEQASYINENILDTVNSVIDEFETKELKQIQSLYTKQAKA